MKREAKFRATCETCGKRQPRATTQWSVERWMDQHEREHRADTATPPASVVPECERTASCEPGDHTYSWPCVHAATSPGQTDGV